MSTRGQRTIAYNIEVDTSALEDARRMLNSIDSSVELEINVDDASITEIRGELERLANLDVDMHINDGNLNEVRSRLERMERLDVDLDMENATNSVASMSGQVNNMEESFGGMTQTAGVFAQFMETSTQQSLSDSLSMTAETRDFNGLVRDNLEIARQMSDIDQERITLNARLNRLRTAGNAEDSEGIASGQTRLNNLNSQRVSLEAMYENNSQAQREANLALDRQNASTTRLGRTVSWVRARWLLVGTAVTAAATAALMMNGHIQDIVSSATESAKQFMNGNFAIVSSYQNAMKLLKVQRKLLVVQAQLQGRSTVASDNAARYMAIADDTSKSYKEREEAMELALAYTRTDMALTVKLNEETRKKNALARDNAATEDDRAKAQATLISEANAGQQTLNALYADERSIQKDINELAQDKNEQQLDFYIDYTASITAINLKIANDEEAFWGDRENALARAVSLNKVAFKEQVENLEKVAKKSIDIKHIQGLQGKAQWAYIESLGLSEIMNNRLLEVVKEQLTVTNDLAEARKGMATDTHQSVYPVQSLETKGLDLPSNKIETPELLTSNAITVYDDFYTRMANYYDLDVEAYRDAEHIKSDIRRMFAEDAADSSSNLMGALADAMEQGNEEMFNASKALRYGEATLAMYAGISNALATPGAEPYTKWIDAAAVAASGVAQMIGISQTQYGDTSVGSGGAVSKPSMSNVAPIVSGRAMFEADNQAKHTKAYVVFSDIQGANAVYNNTMGGNTL